jgi:hypothetical protein
VPLSFLEQDNIIIDRYTMKKKCKELEGNIREREKSVTVLSM